MNNVVLIGRLTRYPELRYSQGNNSIAVVRFTLAVDRRFKKAGEQSEADFIQCKAFNKQAEFIEKYFKQGMKMAISGRIETSSYTNKDGVKVYTTEVIAEDIEFADSKNNNHSNSGIQEPSSAVGDGFMNIPDGIDEELPFS